jgi:hypothetical protein
MSVILEPVNTWTGLINAKKYIDIHGNNALPLINFYLQSAAIAAASPPNFLTSLTTSKAEASISMKK